MKTGNNIRLRKDGRYEARYIKDRNADGKIIYGYCYGKTEEEAASKRALLNPSKQQMKVLNLLILGAGSHGQEIKELAEALRLFKKIAFLDDDTTKENVLGPVKDLEKYLNEYPIAFPAIGNKDLRIKWTEELSKAGYIIPTFIHPNAVVSESAEIGIGTVICAGATIGPGAKAGRGSIIDSGATVGRGAKLPDWTYLKTGQVAK